LIPLAIINGIGSLQCLTSAKKEQDDYANGSSLVMNGVSTVVSACFGNPFPTTLFIGHPTAKLMGARSGYMLLNGVVILFVTTLGLVQWILTWMPIAAILPILVFVGFDITVHGFTTDDHRGLEAESPKRHLIGVAVGIMPALSLLSVQAVQNTMQFSGASWLDVYPKFEAGQYFLGGAISLSQGFLLTCMFWSALTIFIVERKWFHASCCLFTLAALSWIGVIHAFKITSNGIVNVFIGEGGSWIAAPSFVIPYSVFGFFLLVLWGITKVNIKRKQMEMETTINTAGNPIESTFLLPEHQH